jgi:5-oxoprolinase (ATP-hydrolysing)
MFMGAMPKIVKNVIRILGDDVHEGDVILHNDPYGGATHSPDVAIVIPIFFENELVGFAGASAHVLDIGGAYPGLAIDLVDNWSEGQHLPRRQAAGGGVWQAGLWKHILENVRTPSVQQRRHPGDDRGCELAKRRYAELLGRTATRRCSGSRGPGSSTPSACSARRSRRCPTAATRPSSAGSTTTVSTADTKLPVKIAVEIAGDEITFDLTGSSDEVPSGYNCPYRRHDGLGDDLHHADDLPRRGDLPGLRAAERGHARARQRVVAPKGSIFNPNYPRACFARFCQVQRAVDLALRALAPVVPEQDHGGATRRTSTSSPIRGSSRRRASTGSTSRWTRARTAAPGRDGLDSVDCLIANTRNNPIEELEWRFPMRTERYELRDDPCAAGTWRGGIGMVRVNRFLVDTIADLRRGRPRRTAAERRRGAFFGRPHDGILAYG